MAEEQALDRVHRMGQRREVVATRYIVKNSIEEVSKPWSLPAGHPCRFFTDVVFFPQHVVLVQRNKSEIITQTVDSGEPLSAMSLKDCLMKVKKFPSRWKELG